MCHSCQSTIHTVSTCWCCILFLSVRCGCCPLSVSDMADSFPLHTRIFMKWPLYSHQFSTLFWGSSRKQCPETGLFIRQKPCAVNKLLLSFCFTTEKSVICDCPRQIRNRFYFYKCEGCMIFSKRDYVCMWLL